MPIIDFPVPSNDSVSTPKTLKDWPWDNDLGKPYTDINERPEIVGEANDLARYKEDKINPDHYKKGDIEVIDLTRQLGFREGNVVKYVSRHKEKNGKEDILKAMWYLEDILKNDYGC